MTSEGEKIPTSHAFGVRMPDLLAPVCDYFTRRLAEYGPTPLGVDWNGAEAQEAGFRQLLRLLDGHPDWVLGDFGCGYGALLPFARAARFTGEYRGYDLIPAMVTAASDLNAADPFARFATDEGVLAGCNAVVANGVFNLKLTTPVAVWEAYVLRMLDRLAELGANGFAFNALTSYSDPARMRLDLYYPDPCQLFDHCKRRYSRHVALLHDYGRYEFTLIVRRTL